MSIHFHLGHGRQAGLKRCGADDGSSSSNFRLVTCPDCLLIAAAPELLKAAKLARSALDSLLGDSDLPEDDSPGVLACAALSVAIEKAGG